MQINQRWKGFKFTKVSDHHVHTGWEATCYLKEHFLEGNPCRRTRNIGKDGDPGICERRLKWWCLHVGGLSSNTRHSHVHDVKEPKDLNTLPSFEELNAAPVWMDGDGVLYDNR
jgi:hypothetical protein